jgi:hypothetical protein
VCGINRLSSHQILEVGSKQFTGKPQRDYSFIKEKKMFVENLLILVYDAAANNCFLQPQLWEASVFLRLVIH